MPEEVANMSQRLRTALKPRWSQLVCWSLLLLALWTLPARADSQAAAGLEQLKAMAGDWEGQTPEGTRVHVSYQVISGGSAVMEIRAPEKEPTMVTVFHLDGDSLMLTHYCSVGNQPRMSADAFRDGHLDFHFVDVTNLEEPSAGHMHGLSVRFEGPRKVTQVWTWMQDGKETSAEFVLERKGS